MKKILFLLGFIALAILSGVSALNPDRTCPVNANCDLNFILLNTTGYQVGDASCAYDLRYADDLTLYQSGNLTPILSGTPFYQVTLNIPLEATFSMRVQCDLVEGVPAYFMQNVITSNYLNISVIPVNVSINLTEPSNNATLVVGKCPTNTGASAMLWLVFAFALALIILGLVFKIGLVGVIGGLTLAVGSWFIYGCAPMIGFIIGGASIIVIAYFLYTGWIET